MKGMNIKVIFYFI